MRRRGMKRASRLSGNAGRGNIRAQAQSGLDNITSHLAKFEGYRTTIYADVERIATTGIGNRV